MTQITFEKATFAHKPLIFQWLNSPHVVEFWDNSPEHRIDIELFMGGRKKKSPYGDDKYDFHYWIGSIDAVPFSLIMTSELIPKDCVRESSPYTPFLSKKGRSVALDFMIGSETHIGKGLASPTLQAFVEFFHKHNPDFDTFLIDPEEQNPRAKRVYEKAGFKAVGQYIRTEGCHAGSPHFILILNL